jgi:hypothetical protein
MCCGCQKLMDAEGKASIPFARGGWLDAEAIKTLETAPCYADKQTADIAALAAGWEIRDSEGPNHRCPACIIARELSRHAGMVESRGAYIQVPQRANGEHPQATIDN